MAITQAIHDVLAFPGTLTVVTILAAFIAWALYSKQRSDQRRDAARIILHEIESAEPLIIEAKKLISTVAVGGPAQKIQVMKVDSWGTAQHLLAGKLPSDVMQRIANFYANCRLLDEALAFIDAAFAKNESEVRVNAFRVNADYLNEIIKLRQPNPTNDPTIDRDNLELTNKLNLQREEFNRDFPTIYTYRGVKPTNDAKQYLEMLSTELSQGRVGQELRRAGNGFLRRVFFRSG